MRKLPARSGFRGPFGESSPGSAQIVVLAITSHGDRTLKKLLRLACCVSLLAISQCVLAQTSAGPPPSKEGAESACHALASAESAAKFAQIPDAVTSINSAQIVPAGGRHTVADNDLPEICRVEGYIAPTIGFLVRMPTKDWNGKFMMGGCGGPCGNYLEDRIDPALVRNYAVVTTDMGHKGSGWQWAYNNPQGQVDFAYRATHLTALVAKEIIEAFYSRPAAHNYFFGCSTGGRQAMIEAQRFPTDFEGIVAGAPPYEETGDSPYFIDWNVNSNTDESGHPILTAALLPLLHEAVLAACDAADGVKDGVIQNPLACHFDPHTLVCKTSGSSDCLTAAQADVAQKIYDGASDSKGRKLYWGMPRGSEDQWAPWLTPRSSQGLSIVGYMGFSPSAPPSWKTTDFNYDTDPARLSLNRALFNPLNPDLSEFKSAGGKLILFHGDNDNNIPVGASIAYYESAVRTLGGLAQTDTFFKFYTPPGVNHCRGGDGGGSIDWIAALENWVEKGQAPDRLVAYHRPKEYPQVPREVTDYGATYSKFDRFPLDSSEYDRARPLFPYPAIARYKGKGDPTQPDSYVRASP
jgi:feruloyl esterase